MIKSYWSATISALIAGWLCILPVRAAQEGGSTTVTITGTLVETPECTINSNDNINVSFGDEVITNNVDGENYKTLVRYTLSCNNLAQQGLVMMLNGAESSFSSKAFKTDHAGLGIKILNGNEVVAPGNTIKFRNGSPPELYAVPVASNTATLGSGAFNGAATMVIAYQ